MSPLLNVLLLMNATIGIMLGVSIGLKKGIKSICIPIILYLFIIDFVHISLVGSNMYDFFMVKFSLLVPNTIYGILAFIHTKKQIDAKVQKIQFSNYFLYLILILVLFLLYAYIDKINKYDYSYQIISLIFNSLFIFIAQVTVNDKLNDKFGMDKEYVFNLEINKRFLQALFAINISNVITYALSLMKISPEIIYLITYVVSLGAMIYIGYNELFLSKVKFMAKSSFSVVPEDVFIETMADSTTHEQTDENKIYLEETEITTIAKEIEEYLNQNESFYQDSNVGIADLSVAIRKSVKDISYVISRYYKTNFNNYINSLRVEKAKEILESNDYDKYSISGLSDMVGYGSRSAFYASFKKNTGKTPREYQQAYNDKKLEK